MTSRIILVSNTTWNLLNFRMNLAATLREAGFDVHFAGCRDGYEEQIRSSGYEWHEWKIHRSSVNPLLEVRAVNHLRKVYRRVRPDLVHHYTVKPVLYGTTAARLAGVPAIVNSITGLPLIVLSQKRGGLRGLMRSMALRWYAGSLNRPNSTAIFQNEDDLAELVAIRPQIAEKAIITAGSGIDLSRFQVRNSDDLPRSPATVTFVGRLIQEKGIVEFVEAARLVKQSLGDNVRFIAAGGADGGNRSVLSDAELQAWKDENLMEFTGHLNDIRTVLDRSDLIVLPSYREGMPRALLEAAASGLPSVTTNVTGCRDAVVDGETGVLVPVRDSSALAAAIEALLKDPQRMRAFGKAARQRAETVLDEKIVIQQTLDVYRKLLSAA